jgi:hypothetical protein
MNKLFYLALCVTFALAGMEQDFLQDYRNVLAIKKRLIELALQVKKEHKDSDIVINSYRGGAKHDHRMQTTQGFALRWEGYKPKGILWQLGLYEFSDAVVMGDGDKHLQEKIVAEFGATEISREPRTLSSRSGQKIPIGDQQLIIYSLNKLHEMALPQASVKASHLIPEEEAKKICKALETL